ncbi:MAG: hypothetical protein QG600_8 [Patescibacteria group bacterium]|nr:hypothetical protein [Patescibacteria group bacterium]
MENQNPQGEQPTPPSTPQPVPSTPKSKLPLILAGFLTVLIIGGGAYYLGMQNNSQTPYSLTPTPTLMGESTELTKITPTPLPTSAVNDQSDWKTFTGDDYSVKYPVDWTQTGPSDYLNTVQLINSQKTVSITLSKGQYPYGFSGSNNSTTNDISIEIDGKTIQAKEIVSDKGAYVDFKIGEYHILYGTDYPAVGTQASLTDYNQLKETISDILKSFTLNK